MANILFDINNLEQYSLMIPYIRYCNEDYYDTHWLLPERRIFDHELILIISGSVQLQIENRRYRAEAGDLIFFKPNLLHTAKALSLPLRFLCIHFDMYVSSAAGDVLFHQQYMAETIPSHPIQYENLWSLKY